MTGIEQDLSRVAHKGAEAAKTAQESLPSREELLSNLKKRAETAVSEEERAKYSALVQKLETTLSKKVSSAKEEAKGIIADLKLEVELSSEQEDLLRSVEKDIATGAKKAREATGDIAQKALAGAKETAAKTAESIGGKELGSAVKTGDVNKMAQIASDGVKKLGSVAEFAVKLDQAATAMEEKGGIFAILAMILRWFSGIADMFVSKADREKIDAMKKKAEGVVGNMPNQIEAAKTDAITALDRTKTAAQNLREAIRNNNEKAINASKIELVSSLRKTVELKKHLTSEQNEYLKGVYEEFKEHVFDPSFLMDSEFREKWIETQFPKMAQIVSKEFYGGAELDPERMKALRNALGKVKFGQDTVEKLKQRAQNPKDKTAVSFSDPATFLTELTFGNVESFGFLLQVIPPQRFIWSAVKKATSEGVETYQYNVSLLWSKVAGVETPPISFSKDGFVEAIGKFKDQGINQDILLMQMYRVNGLVASILGTAAAAPLAGLMAWKMDTSTGADGWNSAKKLLSLKKDYAGLADEIAKIEQAFPNNPWMASAVRLELESVRKNWLVLSLMQESQSGNIEALKKLVVSEGYKELGITAEMLEANKNGLKEFFLQKFNTAGSASGAASKWLGKISGNASGMANELIDHIHKTKEFQHSLAKGDMLSRLKTLGGTLDVLRLPRVADKALLHFTSIEQATATLQQMKQQVAAYGPWFAREFFKAIPTAGLVIGGIDLASRDLSASEKFVNFGKIAAEVLVPVIGPGMLLFDEKTAMQIEKDGSVKNLGIGLANIGMLTLDGFLLINAARAGKIGQFFLERPKSVIETFGNIARTGNVLKKATPLLRNPQWMAPAMKFAEKMPGRVRAAIVAWLALGGAGYAYAKSHEDMEKKLVEEGFWNKDSADLTPKALETFASFDNSKKREFLDGLLNEFVKKASGKNLASAKMHLENGIYSIMAENPAQAKEWQEAVLSKQSTFGDELLRLGIAIEVTDVETQKKLEESSGADLSGIQKKG